MNIKIRNEAAQNFTGHDFGEILKVPHGCLGADKVNLYFDLTPSLRAAFEKQQGFGLIQCLRPTLRMPTRGCFSFSFCPEAMNLSWGLHLACFGEAERMLDSHNHRSKSQAQSTL